MRTNLLRFLIGGLAAALLTTTTATAVFAQTPAPTPTEKPRAERVDGWLEALAGRLGKTREELRAALVAAQKDMIARALAEGRLTQAQADRLNQRVDQLGGRGGLRAPQIAERVAKARARAAVRIAVTRELAQFLGLQPGELSQELRAGKSLAEVAQAKGKSRDEVKSFLTDQARTRLERAVANGRLTREQADAQLKRLTDGLDQALDRKLPVRARRATIDRGPRLHEAPGELN
jgi:hypothetical protein